MPAKLVIELNSGFNADQHHARLFRAQCNISPSPGHCASSGCEWRRRPPDTGG